MTLILVKSVSTESVLQAQMGSQNFQLLVELLSLRLVLISLFSKDLVIQSLPMVLEL